jgi:hypothetical protein
MAVSRDQRRALRLLSGSPLGVTEAIMLAHGFTIEMLDALMRDGLATAEQREMRAGPDDGRWACSSQRGHPTRRGLGRISGAATCRSSPMQRIPAPGRARPRVSRPARN